MLADYGYIGLFLIVAVLFALVTVLLPFLISLPFRLRNHPYFSSFIPSAVVKYSRLIPYKPNPVKNSTFECGMETIGKTWVQFNFRYYFYALIFVALDIIVLFLYPWAVELRQLGSAGFIGILIFTLILIVGYIYAWKNKVLEWK